MGPPLMQQTSLGIKSIRSFNLTPQRYSPSSSNSSSPHTTIIKNNKMSKNLSTPNSASRLRQDIYQTTPIEIKNSDFHQKDFPGFDLSSVSDRPARPNISRTPPPPLPPSPLRIKRSITSGEIERKKKPDKKNSKTSAFSLQPLIKKFQSSVGLSDESAESKRQKEAVKQEKSVKSKTFSKPFSHNGVSNKKSKSSPKSAEIANVFKTRPQINSDANDNAVGGMNFAGGLDVSMESTRGSGNLISGCIDRWGVDLLWIIINNSYLLLFINGLLLLILVSHC